ncbi:MAG: hypothetical protein AAB336_11890 [Acidobacteriota bacterium]
MKEKVFLIVTLITIFCIQVGKAQENPKINLIGTEWISDNIIIEKPSADSSITKIKHFIIFYEDGKAESMLVSNKSAGMEFKQVLDQVNVGGTTGYELRYVWKYVPTPPETNSKAWAGTYKIGEKVVYLSFPDFSIVANVNKDSMKCVVTYKDTKEKEEWSLIKSKKETNPNSQNLEKPTSDQSDDSSNKNPDIYFEVGNAKLKSKDYQGAILEYNKAIKIFAECEAKEKARKASGGGGITLVFLEMENYPIAYYNRGIAKKFLGDQSGASEDFAKACSLRVSVLSYYNSDFHQKFCQ